jgi:hypothetical protein
MIRLSDCPPWWSDQPGPDRTSPRPAAELHHAKGHDPGRGDKAAAGPADPSVQLRERFPANDMMPWNSRMISRASTRTATPFSIAATGIVSAFDRRSRPTVRRCATVRAEGARANAAGSAFSALFRRALHSLTRRRQPRNPRSRSARHRAAPLRHPASHCSSSQGR